MKRQTREGNALQLHDDEPRVSIIRWICRDLPSASALFPAAVGPTTTTILGAVTRPLYMGHASAPRGRPRPEFPDNLYLGRRSPVDGDTQTLAGSPVVRFPATTLSMPLSTILRLKPKTVFPSTTVPVALFAAIRSPTLIPMPTLHKPAAQKTELFTIRDRAGACR